MGGNVLFPGFCATTMGLAALALENNPVFPTSPHVTREDVTAGLVLPNAAVIFGQGRCCCYFGAYLHENIHLLCPLN